nr:phospholipase D family protein [Candidatus Sigynarchaeota archaeon]
MSEEDESGFKLIDNNFVTSNDTLFSWLSRLLATCDTLNIASAFFSISNPGDHVFKLLHLISRDYTAIKVNLVVSNHLDVHVQKIFKSLVRHKFFKELDEKEKQAFDLLSTLNLEIHIVSEDTKGRSRFFHPKVYLCTKSGTPVSFILGSGNFTPAGLGKSVELLM